MNPHAELTWLDTGDAPKVADDDSKLNADTIGLHDTVLDAFVLDGLVVRSASVRGWANRYYGDPREDSYAISASRDERSLIVGVSDGVSAAAHAHVAAHFLARRSVAMVRDLLDDGPPEHIDWLDVFRTLVAELVNLARRRPAAGEGQPSEPRLQDYAATLTILLVPTGAGGTRRCTSARVGDSPVWTLAGARLRGVDQERSADVVTSDDVLALPFLPAAGPEITTFDLDGSEAVFVMTDGVSDALGAGTSEVAVLFADRLEEPPPPLEFASLVGYRRRSFDDDRTMVGVWARERGSR